MLLQDVEAKTPLFENYCPPDTPCVFSQHVLTETADPMIEVSVVVYSSVKSMPWLKVLDMCNQGGIPCRSIALHGLVDGDDHQQYFYLSVSCPVSSDMQGVFVFVADDSEGDKRGTVSIPDSIGKP